MIIQELIEKYKKYENALYDIGARVACQNFLKDLEQLDELEKVVVPQFVADWIANVKRNGFKFRNTSGYYEEIAPSDDVYRVMYYIFKEGIVGEKIKSWINENRDVFARAWLDGYDIQETKYVVTDGNHLYFKNYQEDIEIVILVDEQPGTMEYVKKFNTKEEA